MRFGDAATLGELDALDWRAFEGVVAELFARRGYATTRIGGLHDHGADVIAANRRERLAVQVKHRARGRRVGERALQAASSSVEVHGCSRGLVVTNSTFAPGLERIAALLDVELWDGERLRTELLSFCVLCGKHVSAHVRDWCLERPEEFGGCVYCFTHQRRLSGLLQTVGRVG